MTYIPPTELLKIPKAIRDNYIEMAAKLAAIEGMYKKENKLDRPTLGQPAFVSTDEPPERNNRDSVV